MGEDGFGVGRAYVPWGFNIMGIFKYYPPIKYYEREF